jgi:hypothetical protein
LVSRLFNLILILSGYFLSRLLRRVIHWGNPVSLSVEPANLCNLHCPECPGGTNQLKRARGIMDLTLYKNLISHLSPTL